MGRAVTEYYNRYHVGLLPHSRCSRVFQKDMEIARAVRVWLWARTQSHSYCSPSQLSKQTSGAVKLETSVQSRPWYE